MRQAFWYAIDRKAIIKDVFGGAATPIACTFTDPIFWPKGINMYDYDVAKAKQLLKDANWNAGDNLDMWTYYGTQQQKDAMQAMQAMLAQVGIKVTPKIMDTPAYNAQFYTGEGWPVSYRGGGISWGQSPRSYMMPSTQTTDKKSWQGFDDPKLNAMIVAAETAMDDATYLKNLQDICKYENENALSASMWVAIRYGVVSAKVKNFAYFPRPVRHRTALRPGKSFRRSSSARPGSTSQHLPAGWNQPAGSTRSAGMTAYIIRRVLISIPVLLSITIIIFGMINLIPGDPAAYFISPDLSTNDEEMAQARERLGLNQPIPVRYLKWLNQTLHGDLGYRIKNHDRVSSILWTRLKATMLLVGVALAIGATLGIVLGVFTSIRKYSLWDYGLTGLSFVGISMPAFVTGIFGLYFLSLKIPIFPAGGMSTVGKPPSPLDTLYHVMLPALLLSLGYFASFMRYTRFSMLEVLRQDYVTTARAKGLAERSVDCQRTPCATRCCPW